jgi:hypothetical protein
MDTPSPPPEGGLIDATAQPACRRGMSETIVYLGTISPKLNAEEAAEMFEQAEPILQRAIEGAKQATKADCASCLEGLGIKCPARAINIEQARYLTRLKSLGYVASRRIIKVAEEGGSLGNLLNRVTIEYLDLVGFRQYAPSERVRPPSVVQESDTIIDRREPKRIENDVLLTEKKEERPPCAGTLASYFKACRKTLSQWVRTGQQRGVKDWSKRKPPGLEVHSALYALGVEQAKDATPEHCANCMGENCPLKKEVPGIEAFNTLKNKISIEGKETKPLDRIDSVLRGVPRRLLAGPPDPMAVWLKVQNILKDLAKRFGTQDVEDF